MDDLLQISEISGALPATPEAGGNFEEVYSSLAVDPSMDDLRTALEMAVSDYFSSLALPDCATLYDHLVLSLRPKDVIATFNWDPFLIQAVRRNGRVGGAPSLLFLHGNVLAGYCDRDRVHGVRGANCSRCSQPLAPTKLLYPIIEKDYESDPAISSSWREARRAFRNAFMVTFFGYGAPTSDRAAVDLLHDAWGDWRQRNMEQVEIIDVRDEDDLLATWEPFIHTHHYEIHRDYYESWIARHPRRSGEAFKSQYLDAQFIDDNPAPRAGALSELWSWFGPLVAAEKASSARADRSR